MLRLIPKPLFRLLLIVAHAIRVVWWRVAKPRKLDCRVVALDGEGRALLVLHSYGRGGWMPPGGRPNRGEDPVAAGIRELYEETGCRLTRAIEVANPDPEAHRCSYVVVGEAQGAPKADGREILEARFCAIDAIPDPYREVVATQLREWIVRYRDAEGSTPNPSPKREGGSETC